MSNKHKLLFYSFIFCAISFGASFSLYSKFRVLIGSPVHQKNLILKEFLASLERLDKSNCDVDYYFIDDNEDQASSEQLINFAKLQTNELHKVIVNKSDCPVETYVCDNNTHYWRDSLIWKVAGFKNKMIDYARDNKYDYLFLIDSDIVLHSQTLNQLINDKKDIVSNIFWTQWNVNSIAAPQVWLYDFYTQYEFVHGEELSQEEALKRTIDFYNKLSQPGLYEVGGLGACTLISKNALSKDINFNKINNVTFWGEDRHFCIRAACLGLKLFVDTNYPAFHIYRDSDLDLVSAYNA